MFRWLLSFFRKPSSPPTAALLTQLLWDTTKHERTVAPIELLALEERILDSYHKLEVLEVHAIPERSCLEGLIREHKHVAH